MPWTTNDVSGFTKAAKTDVQKRQWIAVANGALQKCLDDGGEQDECEARAVRMANGVIKEDEMGEVTVTTTTAWDDQTVTVADNAKIVSAIPELSPGTLINDIVPTESEADTVEETVDGEMAEIGKRINKTQLAQLKAAQETIAAILGWADYADLETEDVEESMAEFSESASGHVVGLAEVKPILPDSVVPLHLDAVLIEPGWGNARDGHYYPREILERDANVFEGVKMYESDHRPGEKSTRTWVSTVTGIGGFTESGAPIGRISVHDRDFAERLLALDADDLLAKMECSILAGGTAKNGKMDGRKAKIVESITEAESVDWVTRAGAGGRALALAETEEGSMEENETEVVEEEIEEVEISEGNEEPETPAPEPLSKEKVTERLGETNLPKASKQRLSVEYADEDALENAVKAEIAYVKELTGSGEVFGMAGEPQSQEPLTEEQRTERFNKRMREVGGREV